MAGSDGSSSDAVEELLSGAVGGAEGSSSEAVTRLLAELEANPYRFGFYQALRRIECAHPDKPRIGRSMRAAEDPVRLGQDPSLAFASSTLSSLQRGKPGFAPRLNVLHFGMLGPNGPLPLHLTEYARDRLRNSDDETFARFLDVFNHRMLSLFYRAWACAQPAVSFDRPEADRFGDYIGSLCGIGTQSLHDRDAMPDLSKHYFAGRLACQTRNAEGLQALLEGFFSIPVRIEQFVGHWMRLPRHSMCRLGDSPVSGTLGMTATIGERVWDRQHKFRIVVGPVSLADYRRLLPIGDSLARLVALVRNYLGDELAWDVQMILSRDQAPPMRLGQSGHLGWTTWLTKGPLAEDADDLMLDPLQYVA